MCPQSQGGLTDERRDTARCFLCGTESGRVVWREGNYEAKECFSCGLVYTSPQPSLGDIDFADEGHPDSFYSLSAHLKASWVSRYCPPGRLLEVGCGNGYFLAAAQVHGYEVYGLEPNLSNARYAEQSLGITVDKSFLEDHMFQKGSFDVVYHCDLLAHFPDPVKALKSMSELLRPGGVLCFEVGLMGGISPLWYRLIGKIGLGPHLWFYSDRALRLLLARSGLQIKRLQYFGLAPRAILARISGVFLKRLVVPLLSATRHLGVFPPPEKAIQLQDKIRNFLRYRAGAFFPRIGPQTLLVIAHPSQNGSGSQK